RTRKRWPLCSCGCSTTALYGSISEPKGSAGRRASRGKRRRRKRCTYSRRWLMLPPRPLKFCMLTTFYPPYHFGGDAIGIQRLARGLVRRGPEVTVIHDVDAYNLLHRGPEPRAESEPKGLTVHRLKSGWGRLSPFLTQQLGRPVLNGRRIRALLEDGRFD